MSRFTADHQGFYLDGAPFFPDFRKNCKSIHLSAKLSDDLCWEKEKTEVERGKFVLWELDLGFSPFTPNDTATFFSHSLAIEEFIKSVWNGLQEESFGVLMYRGDWDLRPLFPQSLWRDHFEEWGGGDEALFAAQMFAEYLHRLAAILPDSLLPLIQVHTEGLSPARKAHLFSGARFEHIYFLKESPPQIASIGIYLPDDSLCDLSVLTTLDQMALSLDAPYRFIHEAKLTEEWDGIDQLIVPEFALSHQGKRKLRGFEAAGGQILWSSKSL
ncbi:MAG: hypothetical protein JSS61_07080 [Verrucomicrobia bacterium]|nr:hypothetical protein [Verrucomicrobiota bacterium]